MAWEFPRWQRSGFLRINGFPVISTVSAISAISTSVNNQRMIKICSKDDPAQSYISSSAFQLFYRMLVRVQWRGRAQGGVNQSIHGSIDSRSFWPFRPRQFATTARSKYLLKMVHSKAMSSNSIGCWRMCGGVGITG